MYASNQIEGGRVQSESSDHSDLHEILPNEKEELKSSVDSTLASYAGMLQAKVAEVRDIQVIKAEHTRMSPELQHAYTLYERYRQFSDAYKESRRYREGQPPTPPEEIEQLKGQLLAVDEEIALTFPALTPELFDELGVHQFEGEVNELLTNNFQKEGQLARSSRFLVATDSSGNNWFLKRMPIFQIPAKHGCEAMSNLSFSLQGVIASRVAQLVGYPIAETNLVIFENKVYEAARYLGHMEDLPIEEAIAKRDTITNPEAVNTRLAFNFLTGNMDHSGEGYQGGTIEGQYFAIDNGARFTKAPMELAERLLNNLDTDPNYRVLAEALVRNKHVIIKMCQRLAELPVNDILTAFDGYVGTTEERNQAPVRLLEYAAALPSILEDLEKRLDIEVK